MARVVLEEQPAASASADELVDLLAEELAGGGDGDYLIEPLRQPLIIEQPMRRTNTTHVAVVWERWRTVPADVRPRVILDAYERADPTAAARITIALPATFAEAADLGLLPWGVEATDTAQCEFGADDLRRHQIDAGAVSTPDGLFLRFPTQAQAAAVRGKLAAATRDEHWQLVRFAREAA